ncbi:MAG: hypothetical protein P1V97_26180, partial [Planctomycetota bacterium]|nr:hypothetical protein [Planctomycetota bacterium]
YVLAALFFGLSGGCLLATKEWAGVAVVVYSNIIILTGFYAFFINRSLEQKKAIRDVKRRQQLVEAGHG